MRFTKYSPSAIKIYNKEGRMVLEELSLVAMLPHDGSIVGMGKEVRENPESFDKDSPKRLEMKEKVMNDPVLLKKYGEFVNTVVLVGSPLKNGTIAELEISKRMFMYFVHKAKVFKLFYKFFKPRIAVCVPVEQTDVETTALRDVMLSIGAKDVLIFEKPYIDVVQDIPSKYGIVIEIIPKQQNNPL